MIQGMLNAVRWRGVTPSPPPPTIFLKIKPKQLRSEEFDDLITFRLMYPIPEGDYDELLELWDSSNSMSIGILIFY